MNLPAGWVPLIALSVLLVGVAVWAGSNLEIGAPAATGAAVLAVLVLVTGWDRRTRARRVEGIFRRAPPTEVPLRAAFTYGRLGREEIILALDRIERVGPNPTLPTRTGDELAELVDRPTADFAEYVEERIADLEART
jgi:hypothetical protein